MEKKIELIPGTRVTIKANSDGSTVTIYEPETPSYQFKDGDFVRSLWCGVMEWFYIYKGIDSGGGILYHAAAAFAKKSDKIVGYDEFGIGLYEEHEDVRLMTTDEKVKMLNLLNRGGKDWDYENKKIVSIQTEFKVGDVVRYKTKNGWSDQYLITGLALELVGSFYKDELYNPVCGKVSFRSGSLNIKLEDSIGTNSFFKLMEENGIKFNPKTGKIEKIRWKPKEGEKYFYITVIGNISYTPRCNINHILDNTNFLTGNYFKTEEQAEVATEKVKKLFSDIQDELYKFKYE